MEILRAIRATFEPRLERIRPETTAASTGETHVRITERSQAAELEVAIRPDGRQSGRGKRCRFRVANGRDAPPVVPSSASRLERVAARAGCAPREPRSLSFRDDRRKEYSASGIPA